MVRSWQVLEDEYLLATPKSRAQWERGKPVMPGGMIRGGNWTSPYPVYMERAEGCYLWDLDGRRYVDFANHSTTLILGHNPAEVVEAIQSELDNGFVIGAPTKLEAEIAEELTKRFPSMDKVRYVNSGTEASLHATRLVRAATGKPKVAKFEGAYHGAHDALEVSISPPLNRAGPSEAPTPVAEWDGMARGAEEDVVLLPYNQPESVELILREHQDELAAVVFDGKPGKLDIPLEFARFLRDLTRELGILMVMDEVISFRVGYGGYQGLADVEPDITVLGKVVGGGLPVGAFGGRADLMDVMDNTQGAPRLSVSGTFSGNNLTLAAGLATLRALTPEIYDRLDGLRERLHQGMVGVFDRAGIGCQVVSAGSMLSLYLTDRPVRDYRAMAGADKMLLEQIRLALILKGQNVPADLSLTLTAPMGTEHIDELLEATSQVLTDNGA